MHIRSKAIASAVAIIYLNAIGCHWSAAATSKLSLVAHDIDRTFRALLWSTLASRPKGNPNAGNPPGTRAPTQTWKDPKGNPNAGNPPGTRAPTQTFARHHVR